MTPAGAAILEEIRAAGPIRFARFMELALYHPRHGYYRRARREQGADPFGIHGDFYTATQFQPVFGRLIAGLCAQWRAGLGAGADFHVVEWGAGRGEMAAHFEGLSYHAVDIDGGDAPSAFEGVVFCNELFDALPVDVVRLRGDRMRMMRVGFDGTRFQWAEGEEVPDEWRAYAERLGGHLRALREDDELWIELPVALDATLRRMTRPLTRGRVLAIDYGYTEREVARFPRGTLMAYFRHRALDDVLLEPGERDITAHVPFTHLEQCAQALGLTAQPLRNLSSLLLSAGEADQFASALRAPGEAEALRLCMQLKSLLFGMGETFRCLVLERSA